MVRRRVVSLAIVSCMAGGMVAGVSAPAAAAAQPLPSNATVYMPGHGWGHGRGMGQWGANGMAQDGSTYRSILTHYYSGVSFAARPKGETIRVLVESSPDVIVTSATAFAIKLSTGTRLATSDSTYKFWRLRYVNSKYVLDKSSAWNGPWTGATNPSSYVVFAPGSSKIELVLSSGAVRMYRGSIIARYSSADGMRALNALTLEQYLYGSVPHESPASWPAEQLKAQAVAARSYAVYKKDAARANGTMFDICATTACQVYIGYATRTAPGGTLKAQEYSSSNAAVDGTAGLVLTYGGKPILAEYSSSTGGYSSPGSVAYQKAVPDSGDKVSPHHSWTGVITAADVEKKWPQIGRLVDVRVASRNGYGDWGGRVNSIAITGTDSIINVGGGTWSSAFGWPSRSKGLQSSWFDIRYWRAELVSAPSSISIPSGGTATVVVRLKNTGNQAWTIGGPVRITAPAGSRFESSKWINSTLAASVSRNVTDTSKKTVGRDEVGEFRIPLSATGVLPGNYSQRFGSVVSSYSVLSPAFTLAVQVLPSWTEEAPNMLLNPSFEYGLGGWKRSGFTSSDGIGGSSARDGASVVQMLGGTKTVAQTIAVTGRARRFVFGGWTRSASTSSSGRGPELAVVAAYTDGTTDVAKLRFSATAHPWTYDEGALTTSATKTLSSVRVSAAIIRQTGTIAFDALRLVESPVANPSFERGLTGWGASGFASGDGVVTTAARDGGKSLSLGATGTESVTQVVPLAGRRSERFVAGVWTKATGTDAAGGAMAMTVTFKQADGSSSAVATQIPKAAHDWTFTQALVSAPVNFTSASVTISRASQTGTLLVDDVRVSRAWNANPWFEGSLDPWWAIGSGVTLGAPAREGAKGVTLRGSGAQAVRETFALWGGAGKLLLVSGWTRAIGTDPSKGFLGVRLVFTNSDESISTVSVPFSRSSHQWQYEEHAVRAPKSFLSVDVVAMISNQPGTTSFDGVRVLNA